MYIGVIRAVFKILRNIPVFMHLLKIWDKMGERMTPLSFRMLTGILLLPLLLRLFRLLISVKISLGVVSSNTIELGKFFSHVSL